MLVFFYSIFFKIQFYKAKEFQLLYDVMFNELIT